MEILREVGELMCSEVWREKSDRRTEKQGG